MEDVEKRLIRLEAIEDIKPRLLRLEQTAAVVGVLVVVFGAAGAWGWSALSSARSELKELSEKIHDTAATINEINVAKDLALGDLKKSAATFGNAAVENAVRDAIQSKGPFALAKGSIIAWPYDPKEPDKWPIPQGWHLCDGTSGTPNLLNRVITGATLESAGESSDWLVGTWSHTPNRIILSGTELTFAPWHAVSIAFIMKL